MLGPQLGRHSLEARWVRIGHGKRLRDPGRGGPAPLHGVLPKITSKLNLD